MATHFSILTWRIPMDRGTWWATVHGVALHMTEVTEHAYSTSICRLGVNQEANILDN